MMRFTLCIANRMVRCGPERFTRGSGDCAMARGVRFTTKDGLPSDKISVITGNESGRIFVGTPDGLAELRNDKWIQLQHTRRVTAR